MAKYVSGRVKNLKVGITSYSEDKTSLTVVGKIALGGQTISGGDAFTVNGNVGIGTTNPTTAVTSANTAVLAAGIITAYKYYGDDSNLTGTLKVGTAITAHAGIITANKFVKIGGLSSQFLKADGSVDTSSYNDTLDSVLGLSLIHI